MDTKKMIKTIKNLDKNYGFYFGLDDIYGEEPRFRASQLIWKLNESLNWAQKIILHNNLSGANQIVPCYAGYIAHHIYHDSGDLVYSDDGNTNVSWSDIEIELDAYEETVAIKRPVHYLIKHAAIFIAILSVAVGFCDVIFYAGLSFAFSMFGAGIAIVLAIIIIFFCFMGYILV